MKRIILFGCLVCLFAGCIKDKSNYEYNELDTPDWKFVNIFNIPVKAGDTVKAVIPFTYDRPDSLTLYANNRYEWRINNILISEQKDLNLPVDSIIEMLNLPFAQLSSLQVQGTFSVINTTTGIQHMARFRLQTLWKYYYADWLILSDNGPKSKLSFIKKGSNIDPNGNTLITYTLSDNIFETVNNTSLIGKPLKLRYSQARDISTAVGATSVITDQGAYVLNNEDLKLVAQYKDDFLDGTPANFNVANIFHSKLLAYIATTDGRLFRRVLTDNWLGGKFLTQPYIIDEKGYKIVDFGVGKAGSSANQISPAYDELNRRIVMIQMIVPYKIMPVTSIVGMTHPTPANAMPEGTEILYLGAASHIALSNPFNLFKMVYNDINGNTFMSDFVVTNTDARMVEHAAAMRMPFPGGNLPVGTKFLGTGDKYKKDFLFYTKRNELRYINLTDNVDRTYFRFEHNITDIKYAAYPVNYNQIALGFDNGDFLMLDISIVADPKIIPESKKNVGGRIVDIMEIRSDTYTDAY